MSSEARLRRMGLSHLGSDPEALNSQLESDIAEIRSKAELRRQGKLPQLTAEELCLDAVTWKEEWDRNLPENAREDSVPFDVRLERSGLKGLVSQREKFKATLKDLQEGLLSKFGNGTATAEDEEALFDLQVISKYYAIMEKALDR